MTSTDERNTPDGKIVDCAKDWRAVEKAAIGSRNDRDLQRKEYTARRNLREAIDLAVARST